MSNLDEVMQIASEFLLSRYADEPADFEAMPMIMFDAQEGLYVMPAPWRDNGEKDQMLRTTRRILVAKDASCYVILCEGWLASVDMNKNPELARVAPRDREDRVEVASIYGADKDGNVAFRQFLIDRDGKHPKLTPYDITRGEKDHTVGGTFLTLMEDPPYVSEPEREHLRTTIDNHAVRKEDVRRYYQ